MNIKKKINTSNNILSVALEYKTFMGILPEIKRVWMTVDTDLYLWDYMDG